MEGYQREDVRHEEHHEQSTGPTGGLGTTAGGTTGGTPMSTGGEGLAQKAGRKAEEFKEDVKGMMPGGGQERTSYEHEKHTEGRTGF